MTVLNLGTTIANYTDSVLIRAEYYNTTSPASLISGATVNVSIDGIQNYSMIDHGFGNYSYNFNVTVAEWSVGAHNFTIYADGTSSYFAANSSTSYNITVERTPTRIINPSYSSGSTIGNLNIGDSRTF